MNSILRVAVCLGLYALSAGRLPANDARYFSIRVVDEQTERGVPLVQLRTVNDVSYWTDSAGYVAIDEPSLVGKPVYFHVSSHGYEFPADGFGFRGARLTVQPGKTATVKLKRKNIAERLYRVTGEGIYRDSVMLNRPVPLEQPLLNAGVLGSDSVLTAVYRGEIYWFWGDTNLANYPLGIFDVPGATSHLPGRGGLDPLKGVNLNYFKDESGIAKPTCKLEGDGPTWIFGLTVLGGEDSSTQSMVAGYAKIKPPLEVYERGIVEWDDANKSFVRRVRFPKSQQAYPKGHPILREQSGKQFVYYCDPLPLVRVEATEAAIVDPTQYEVYSYVKDGSRADGIQLDRDTSGSLVWRWRRDSVLPTRQLEERLARDKQLTEEERVFRMRTANSDRRWTLHTSSIAWNEYRERWIMIGLEVGGESSYLGEVYYSEAEDLMGPWSPGKKIVTHDRYSFYNPRLHPMLSQENGLVVYFEGTFTQTFSAAPHPTPRYDYNQIMYRLDLGDERLLGSFAK